MGNTATAGPRVVKSQNPPIVTAGRDLSTWGAADADWDRLPQALPRACFGARPNWRLHRRLHLAFGSPSESLRAGTCSLPKKSTTTKRFGRPSVLEDVRSA